MWNAHCKQDIVATHKLYRQSLALGIGMPVLERKEEKKKRNNLGFISGKLL